MGNDLGKCERRWPLETSSNGIVHKCRILTVSKFRGRAKDPLQESNLVKKTGFTLKIGLKDELTQWGFDTFVPYPNDTVNH